MPDEKALVPRKLRSEIPREHCTSDDARIVWLWNQRMATVQSIFMRSRDVKTRMAASLILNAAFAQQLPAIVLLLQRLEGGAVTDQAILDSDSMPL